MEIGAMVGASIGLGGAFLYSVAGGEWIVRTVLVFYISTVALILGGMWIGWGLGDE